MNPISPKMEVNPIFNNQTVVEGPKSQAMAEVDKVAKERIAEAGCCCECCTSDVRMYTGIGLIATCILAPCGIGLALSAFFGDDSF